MWDTNIATFEINPIVEIDHLLRPSKKVRLGSIVVVLGNMLHRFRFRVTWGVPPGWRGTRGRPNARLRFREPWCWSDHVEEAAGTRSMARRLAGHPERRGRSSHPHDRALSEEAPEVYKDVDEVMHASETAAQTNVQSTTEGRREEAESHAERCMALTAMHWSRAA